MKRSKGGIIITNHSKRRANQRAGITRNQMSTMSKRALNNGIKHSESKGRLRDWMDAEYLKYETANNCRFYANQLYIFHGLTLITIINAPLYYEKELYKYVKNVKIYLCYKKNRYKNKKNYTEMMNEVFTEDLINKIIYDISNYLSSLDYENHYPYEIIKVCPASFHVNIAYYNKKLNEDLTKKIDSFVSKRYGLGTQYIKTKRNKEE